MILFILSLLVIYLAYFYLIRARKLDNEAPGPTPLPLIGNLHQIFKNDKIVFLGLHNSLYKKYGNVSTFWFGPRKQCLISGHDELKEMMHNPLFDDRAPDTARKAIFDEVYQDQNPKEPNKGILFASGQTWNTLRRFTLRSLRDHGFGKKTAETFILEESVYMVEYLKKRIANDNVVNNVNEIFTMMALNVVWQIGSGERFNFEEEGMIKLLQLMQFINEVFWNIFASPLTPMPFLRHFQPFKGRVMDAKEKMGELHDFYKRAIKRHQDTFDPNNIRDVIDAFLLQKQEMDKSDKNQTETIYFTEHQLMIILSDIFLAGSETSGKSMEWACLFMILYPEVQKKVQDEIDKVVGSSMQYVTASHRLELPYTDATLHEIFRLGPVGPLAAVRTPKEDVKIGKYTVYKNTVVFPNLYSMTRDPEHWGPDVNEFVPERFITTENTVKIDPWLMTFGTGRRKCLGESVAKIENFLFFANLLKHFKMKIPQGCSRPTIEPHDGMTIGPKHFLIEFALR